MGVDAVDRKHTSCHFATKGTKGDKNIFKNHKLGVITAVSHSLTLIGTVEFDLNRILALPAWANTSCLLHFLGEVVKQGTMEMEMETEMGTEMEMEMEMEIHSSLLLAWCRSCSQY